MKIYQVGNILIHTVEHSLWLEGERLFMSTIGFEILIMLIEAENQAVSKDEFLGKVWQGSIVEEGNLAVQVCKLRKILASSHSGRVIETVHGFGYRLACKVDEVDESVWVEMTQSVTDGITTPFRGSSANTIIRKMTIHDQNVVVKIQIEDEQSISDAHNSHKDTLA